MRGEANLTYDTAIKIATDAEIVAAQDKIIQNQFKSLDISNSGNKSTNDLSGVSDSGQSEVQNVTLHSEDEETSIEQGAEEATCNPEAGAISEIQGIFLINSCSHQGVEGASNRSNEGVEASPGAVEESSPGVERPKPDGSATHVIPHSISNVSAKNSAGIVGDEGLEAASIHVQYKMTTVCHMCIMKIVLDTT